MEPSLNVLGQKLQPCSTRPMTGFYRNGCCDTGPEDAGRHDRNAAKAQRPVAGQPPPGAPREPSAEPS